MPFQRPFGRVDDFHFRHFFAFEIAIVLFDEINE